MSQLLSIFGPIFSNMVTHLGWWSIQLFKNTLSLCIVSIYFMIVQGPTVIWFQLIFHNPKSVFEYNRPCTLSRFFVYLHELSIFFLLLNVLWLFHVKCWDMLAWLDGVIFFFLYNVFIFSFHFFFLKKKKLSLKWQCRSNKQLNQMIQEKKNYKSQKYCLFPSIS